MPDFPSDNTPTADGSDPSPSGGGRARGPRLEQPGDEVGPYRLVSEIGEGGFGTVWVAERRQPFVQRVALKIVKPGMDSRAVVARFEQERQALAVMDHPNIARVLDGGLTPAGRPYFAMELVKGEPITDFCDRNRLTLHQRIELFIPVCEAVQHAHMKGIIHRDLKPSNILVMVRDEQPMAKVIDFGVAKAISHSLTEKTIYTETGQLIGTPEYMSPEQAEMGRLDVDTRTDVYALGVVLYELLAGALPFESKELRSKGFAEIQRIIREVDPPRPSTRLTSLGGAAADVARRRQVNLGDLKGQLTHELEWIPLKAIRKDRTQRYRTPSDLADDLRNYLSGKPLVAAPESAVYRIRKYVRRNRALVLGASAVIGALLFGLGLAVWQWGEAVNAKDAALESEAAALEAEKKARESEAAALEAEKMALAASDELRKERDRLSQALADLQAAQQERRKAEEIASARGAQRMETYSRVISRAATLVDAADEIEAHRQLALCDADLRDWEWSYLWAASDESIFSLELPTDFGSSVVRFSPDGSRLVIGGARRVWSWDASSFEPRSAVVLPSEFNRLARERSGPMAGAVFESATLAADGRHALVRYKSKLASEGLAVLDIEKPAIVSVIDVVKAEPGAPSLPALESPVISPDGSRVAFLRAPGTRGFTGMEKRVGTVEVYDGTSGARLSTFRAAVEYSVQMQFDRGGALIAMVIPLGSYQYAVEVHDSATGERVAMHANAQNRFSDSGFVFGDAVVVDGGSSLGIIDLRSGDERESLPQAGVLAGYAGSVFVSRDHARAVIEISGSDSNHSRVYAADLRDQPAGVGAPRSLLRLSSSGNLSVDIDPASRFLVIDTGTDRSVGRPRVIRAWDLRHPGAQGVFAVSGAPVRSLAFGAGDREVVVAHQDGGESRVAMPERLAVLGAVKAAAPQGAVKVVEVAGAADSAKEFAIVSEADGREIVRFTPSSGRPTAAVLLPGGARAAVGLDAGGVMVLSAATGAELLRIGGDSAFRPVPKGAVRALAVSGDGTRLAAAIDSGHLVVWDVRSSRDRDLDTAMRREMNSAKLPGRAASGIERDPKLGDAQKARARAMLAQLEHLGAGVGGFVSATLAKKDATQEELAEALRLHDEVAHPAGPAENETCWTSAELSYAVGRYADTIRWLGGEDAAIRSVQEDDAGRYASFVALSLHGLGKPAEAARAARVLVRDPFVAPKRQPEEKRPEADEALIAKARTTLFGQADEARAWERVKERVDRRESIAQMTEAFAKDGTLSANERALAISFAAWGAAQASRLNAAAWAVVSQTGPVAGFAKPLDQAERAVALLPDDHTCVNTLAVARYRSGKYAEALAALERAKALATKDGGAENTSDMIFLAMTRFRLGEVDAAKAELARVKERKNLAEKDRAFLREAEALIAGKDRAAGK